MNESIVKLNYLDKEIYLVKTAHVSKNSIEDVDACIAEIKPDSICIELDAQRYDKIQNPDAWRQTDLVKVIKDKQVGFLLVNTILASFQKRMAKTMDSTSGGEMMEGIKLAKENNINLVLADRSVKTTFGRIWAKLGTKEKFKLLVDSISSIFEDEDITEEDIAALKEADALEAALLDIGKQYPTVKQVLVDERDQYLCQKIKTAPGKKIVAIIGAAHAKGIEKNLDNNSISIKELDTVEKKKGASKIGKWIIPVIVAAIIIYSIIKNKQLGLQQLKSWVLWHCILSAIGASLSLAHPLSILTAVITSPFTLIPGWFAGLVEASIRKPKVKDFEDIADDTATFKGFWKNRVTRTLIVVMLTNLFSKIAKWLSGIEIIKSFLQSL